MTIVMKEFTNRLNLSQVMALSRMHPLQNGSLAGRQLSTLESVFKRPLLTSKLMTDLMVQASPMQTSWTRRLSRRWSTIAAVKRKQHRESSLLRKQRITIHHIGAWTNALAKLHKKMKLSRSPLLVRNLYRTKRQERQPLIETRRSISCMEIRARIDYVTRLSVRLRHPGTIKRLMSQTFTRYPQTMRWKYKRSTRWSTWKMTVNGPHRWPKWAVFRIGRTLHWGLLTRQISLRLSADRRARLMASGGEG